MPLTPGKKYFIEATKEKISKRDVSDGVSTVEHTDTWENYYQPKIDYTVKEGSSFSTGRLTGGENVPPYNHGGLGFVGANRIIKENAKYNEIYEIIKNDQIYKIGSDAGISYIHNVLDNGVPATITKTYNHGDLLETDGREEQTFTTIKGDPIFIEIAQYGNILQDGQYYVVFASSDFVWGDDSGIKYGGQEYFPGDIIEGTDSKFQVYDGTDWVDHTSQGADKDHIDNHGHMRCFVVSISNLTSYTSATLQKESCYLVLGRGNHSYNGQTINTAPHLRNVFQYKTSEDGITWDDGGSLSNRKYPVIKEIVKSGDLVRGIGYEIEKDYKASNNVYVKYDETLYKEGESFTGRFGLSKYSVVEKKHDTSYDDKDSDPADFVTNEPSENINRDSGNPFLLRKEALGLEVTKEYILSSPSRSEITVTLTGATSSDKIQIDGAAAVGYTATLLTTSDQLKFKISTSNNSRFYWEGANASIYPVITSLPDHSEIGVYSKGDGEILYPARSLYNICVGQGIDPDEYGKVTAAELVADTDIIQKCKNAGGNWVPQVSDFFDTNINRYSNYETFNAAGGTCDIVQYNGEEVACKANGGTWTPDSNFNVIPDSLFTYRTKLNDEEQSYPITVELAKEEPSTSAWAAIVVKPLTTPLKVDDCIIFNNGDAYFIVGNGYDIGDTMLDGKFYGKPLGVGEEKDSNGLLDSPIPGVLGIQPRDENSANPYENYYVEDIAGRSGVDSAGSILINKSFSHGQRFKGFSEYKFIRAYSQSSDLSETVSAHGKIKVYKVSTTTAASGTNYTVGGGYITFKEETKYGAGSGRVVVNHQSNIDNHLDEKTTTELIQENAHYLYKGTATDPALVGVQPLPSHIPAGQVIMFPNGTLKVSHNANKGDTVLKGEIGSDYREDDTNSVVYHRDESFYYSFEAQTIDGDDSTITTHNNSFIYKTAVEDWVESTEEIDPSHDPVGTSGFRWLIEVDDGQEYFVQVDPTIVSTIENNKSYTVKGDASVVEIDPPLTNPLTTYNAGSHTLPIKLLSHDLAVGTELVFYPAHPERNFRGVTEEEENIEDDEPTDWWAGKGELRRFVLTSAASAGDITITGTLTGSSQSTVVLGAGAKAEIFREIAYNGKIFKAGESFIGKKESKPIEGQTITVAQTGHSLNSKTGLYNSTKAEKIIAQHELIDYFAEKEIFAGETFNFEVKEDSQFSFSDTSLDTNADKKTGDISGSQVKREENAGMKLLFLPRFGLIRKTLPTAKIYKLEAAHGKKLPNVNDLAEDFNSYTQTTHGQNSIEIKVGGTGSGKITYGSTDVALGDTVEFSGDTEIALSPSSPCLYQKNVETGFINGKFYYIETTHTDISLSVHHKILKTNNNRYYPFISSEEEDYVGTAIRKPYLESFVFGRSFNPTLENRLRDSAYLDDIEILKVTNGTYTEDTSLINTTRYFTLARNSFASFFTLVNKKYNNKWSGWELLSKGIPPVVEKASGADNATRNVRVYDGADLNSSLDDLRFKVISSRESNYSANYPDLVSVIEEKRPKLINGLEDERLYMVESGSNDGIIYAAYAGNGTHISDVGYGFNCEEATNGIYNTNQFFYGKTDAWNNDKLTKDTVGSTSVLEKKFGNFDEYHIKHDNNDSQYLVSECFDPWEIQRDRVYTVRCDAKEAIEYNGRTYKNGTYITGKSINSQGSLVSDGTMRSLMTAAEYEVARKTTIQPWMISEDESVSRERGYKNLSPLLYSGEGGAVTTVSGKKYVEVDSSLNRLAFPDNEFIGKNGVSLPGSVTVLQKVEDGQTVIPNQTYYLYGQGKAQYPYSIVPAADADVDSTSITVESIPVAVSAGEVLAFNNGAEFLITSDAVVGVGTLSGLVRKGPSVKASSISPVVKNHFGATKIKATGSIVTGHHQSDLAIESLPQDLFKGEVLKFGASPENPTGPAVNIVVLTSNAKAGDLSLSVDTVGTVSIGPGAEANIIDYKELKLKEIKADNNVTNTSADNAFKGILGFSRVGKKIGHIEVLTPATTAHNGLLYKIFGTGSVTYNGPTYYASNVWYGDGSTLSPGAGNTIKEIIDPEDVTSGMTVKAYGRPTVDLDVNLFDYDNDNDEESEPLYLRHDDSRTVLATDSKFKVHTIPFTENSLGFVNNKPTISSSRIYGINPGVRYIVQSNDTKTDDSSRRAVVKYVRSTGSCKRRDGTALSNEKYKTRNDCIRRDVLTVDFDGAPSDQLSQNSGEEFIEYGDYKTDGVKVKIQADYLNQYDINVVLKDGQELIFSKGGRFVLSADVDLTGVAAEAGFYYLTIYGVIPFGHSLYNYEFAPLLDWVPAVEDNYISSDNTLSPQQGSFKAAEANGNIEAGILYTVEAGIEIYYDGFETDETTVKTIHKLGEQFIAKTGNTNWTYTANSNKFEFITRTDKADNEFIGVQGRPYIEVIEGNPKIYEKADSILNGEYTIAGPDTVYYGKDISESVSYFDEFCNNAVPSISPNSDKYLAGSYSFGILYGEAGDTSFVSAGDESWVYSSDAIGRTSILVDTSKGDAVRSSFSPATGISEAEDFVNFSEQLFSIYDGGTAKTQDEVQNYYAVIDAFVEFDTNKDDSEYFPEITERRLAYKETGASKLFDMSLDGFYESSGGNEYKAAVFGAGEFAIHYTFSEVIDGVTHTNFFETSKYKAYSNLSESPSATQGKDVSALDENFIYKVKTGPIDYRDKLLVIDNDRGYSSINSAGEQVVFENKTDWANDSFGNSTTYGIKARREGKLSGSFAVNDIFIFESKITSTSASSSTQISVEELPVNIQAGEILFFKGSQAVENYVEGNYYYTEDVEIDGVKFGTYGYSRVFKASNNNSIGFDIVYNAVTVTVSKNAGAGTQEIHGVASSPINSGAICYREVAVKIKEEIASLDTEIPCSISDPLYVTDTSNDALKIRSLDNGQIASKAFNSSLVEEKAYVFSTYEANDKFKAAYDTAWRGSGEVAFSNIIDVKTDLFRVDKFSADGTYGEYTHGHPKVLYLLFGYTNGGTASTFDVTTLAGAIDNGQIHLYDLDYSDTNRLTIADTNIPAYKREGKNNFFVVGASSEISDLSDKTYLYKPVMSGDIVSGKKYIVYGVGSIIYDRKEISASTNFVDTAFTGGAEAYYLENAGHRRPFGYSSKTNTIGSIPANEAIYFLGRPIVYERILTMDIIAGTKSMTNASSGDIIYVFGDGSLKYDKKTIYATNQYVAVSSSLDPANSPKLIPAGAIDYGTKKINTLGDPYDLSTTSTVISPIRNVFGYTDFRATNKDEISVNGEIIKNDGYKNATYVYRKLNSSELIETGKRYYIYGMGDYVTYNNYRYYPRGLGRADIIISGGSDDIITYTNSTRTITTDSISSSNDFSSIQVGDIFWASYQKNGEQVVVPRVVYSKTDSQNIVLTTALIDLPEGAYTPVLNPYFQVSVPKGQPNYSSRGALGKTSSTGSFNFGTPKTSRYLTKRNILYKKGASCCIEIEKIEDTVVRHSSKTYASKYGYSGSNSSMGIPQGFVYAVRGRGEIIYPVWQGDKSADSSYSLVYGTGATAWYSHDTLSKTLRAGSVFSAIESSPGGGNPAKYYWKIKGTERVHKISNNYTKLTEKINSMDQFLDVAPSKYGIDSGEVRYDEREYEVLWIGPDGLIQKEAGGCSNPDMTTKKSCEDYELEDGTKGVWTSTGNVEYNGKTIQVGETFKPVMIGDKVISKFKPSDKDKIIVRPKEGILNKAPVGGWSNEWSMFMNTTHHHPSRTSMWHHDYYGDVMSFLNNRCHIMSEDFKLSRYGHLLETFSYGIKPVIRSEAPPGYQFLEGSNADAAWYWYGLEGAQANKWYYSSCQIYKPDYQISSTKQKDIIDILGDNNLTLDSVTDEFAGGVCQGAREFGDSSVKDSSKLDQDSCILKGGRWITLKDQVIVTLDRRLQHTENTDWNDNRDLSVVEFAQVWGEACKKLWDNLKDPAKDPYRTDENALLEYLIRENYNTRKQRGWCRGATSESGAIQTEELCLSRGGEWVSSGVEDENGNIQNEIVKLQCPKARIGDAAPDTFVWQLPDDPFGACEPRFYFSKHVPYVYDNDSVDEPWIKTPVTVDPFIQMETYLRGFCGGFIDKKSDPIADEITQYLSKSGEMKLINQTCAKSKDYDYLFENLAFQSLDDTGNFKSIFKEYNKVSIKTDQSAVVKRTIDISGLRSRAAGAGWIIFRKYNEKIDGEEAGNNKGEILVAQSNTTQEIKGVRVGALVKSNALDEFGNAGPSFSEFWNTYTIPLKFGESIGTVEQNYSTIYYALETSNFFNGDVGGTTTLTTILSPEGDLSILKHYQNQATISFTADESAKHYAVEFKKAVLPHETEWKIYENEIVPRKAYLEQKKSNSKITAADRPPANYFDLIDVDLTTGLDDDPAYAGLKKEYSIRLRPYYKQLTGGVCSETGKTTKISCLRAGGTWTPISAQTSGNFSESDKTRKVDAVIKGYPRRIKFKEAGSPALIMSSENGVFTFRIKNLFPVAFNTKTNYNNIELETVYINGSPTTVKKLYYDIEYKIKYSYEKAAEDDTTNIRRGEWQNLRTYRDIKKGREIICVDDRTYEFETINYRVVKLVSRTGGSRWISPLNLIDELTDYPDDIKGFGPLPNIKLRASIFNQFANSINLLNEARVDLPITVRYRNHVKFVAKPCETAPEEDISIKRSLVHAGLNVPAPTLGTWAETEFTMHGFQGGAAGWADRYEFVDIDWGANTIMQDGWGRDRTYISEWYESYGHTYLQADRHYGFLGTPFIGGEGFVEPAGTWAVGGQKVDVEISIAGNQLAFEYAVPRMLKSRIKPNSLVLSGRMDYTNIWTPEMRNLKEEYGAIAGFNIDYPDGTGRVANYYGIKDYNSQLGEGEEPLDLPSICGLPDLTSFSGRPHSSYDFLNMYQNHGGNRYVIFTEKIEQHSYCWDIEGTFMLKAPELEGGYSGIITTPHGTNYQDYCLKGGSASSLGFATNASTGDNNLRVEIPVVDKLLFLAHWKYTEVKKKPVEKAKQANKDNKDKTQKPDIGS